MNKQYKHKHELEQFKNKLLLSKNLISIDTALTNEDNSVLMSYVIHSFNTYGYTLSIDAYNLLSKTSIKNITYFYYKGVSLLKRAVGKTSHPVFYTNFPMLSDMTEFDYIINAIVHYYTVTKDSYGYMPSSNVEREKLTDNIKFKELNVVTHEEKEEIVNKMITNYFEGRVAIPKNLHNDLSGYLKHYSNVIKPNTIPFKENLGLYAKSVSLEEAMKYVDTITDLLRLYASISDCDVSLLNHIKFKSLKRSERRVFVSKLNGLCNKYSFDELHLHEHYFKKMFEKLHVGEYAKDYPVLYDIVSSFRESDYQTYNSKVSSSYNNKDEKSLLSLLKAKPGIFARMIDSLIRNDGFDTNNVINSFSEVANKVSSKLLLDLWKFYLNRDVEDDRTFLVRTMNGTYLHVEEDLRNKVDPSVCESIINVLKDSLSKQFSILDPIDKVYLDDSMKKFAIPKNDRNVSSSIRTLTFGSRVNIESEKKILRFFTHWKNGKNRIDIDLSMNLYDDGFKHVRNLSWHSMYGTKDLDCYHSGDITSAPKGASEFIDLNIEKASKIARYAVICNNVFTCDKFSEIEECFSGVMFREKSNSGEIYEPSTVEHKFNLTQDSYGTNVAFLVDLHTKELIWIDQQLVSCQSSVCSYSESNNLVLLIKQALRKQISMFDLIMLHSSRLNFVEKEEAEFVVSDIDCAQLRPYDFDQWINYM